MDNKRKTLIAGALIGAVTGLFAAMLLARRADKEGADITISTGEGLRLGLLVIGLLRSISTLGDE
jgi:gas vesicle protein